jgi:hypothetical protein
MSKYRSKKTVVIGKKFDSLKEARRFQELTLLAKAGAITDLRRQVPFELIPAQYEYFERYGKKGQRLKDGKRCIEKSVVYNADFVYYENGKKIVEDVKGYKQSTAYAVFAIKRKLMLSVHGIKIREV